LGDARGSENNATDIDVRFGGDSLYENNTEPNTASSIILATAA